MQVSEHPWFLQNLPPDALSMNQNFLNHTNFTGVQTVEEIQAILRTAQTPGPGESEVNCEAGFCGAHPVTPSLCIGLW